MGQRAVGSFGSRSTTWFHVTRSESHHVVLGEEYDRHILGGHSMKGRQTAATYARDTLTSPIKKLEEVIASVRHGSFLPDSSRSNMFPSATGKTDA